MWTYGWIYRRRKTFFWASILAAQHDEVMWKVLLSELIWYNKKRYEWHAFLCILWMCSFFTEKWQLIFCRIFLKQIWTKSWEKFSSTWTLQVSGIAGGELDCHVFNDALEFLFATHNCHFSLEVEFYIKITPFQICLSPMEWLY